MTNTEAPRPITPGTVIRVLAAAGRGTPLAAYPTALAPYLPACVRGGLVTTDGGTVRRTPKGEALYRRA